MSIRFNEKCKMAFYAALAGVLAGISAAIFLHLLRWATNYRQEHRELIWGLPLAGLFIGWVYHVYGKEATAGNNLILDQIHHGNKVVPLRMAPLILFSTVLTHLVGGSVGREGTAVQMGGSLADRLAHFLKLNASQRRRILIAGLGAGFSGAIGAPVAGALFGMEVIHSGRVEWRVSMEAFIASFTAYGTSLLLQVSHTSYPYSRFVTFDFKVLAWILLAGIVFGLTARLFVRTVHLFERGVRRVIFYPPLIPLVGGAMLALLFYWEGSYRYTGLGLQYIQSAFMQKSALHEPIYKFLFTVLSVGTGFKGGEFIPLVYIGTTLGSAISMWIPAPSTLLSTVGFGAVFAGASNTPFACTAMIMEIFGWRYGLYGLAACYVSFLCSGSKGIYVSQKLAPQPVKNLRSSRP